MSNRPYTSVRSRDPRGTPESLNSIAHGRAFGQSAFVAQPGVIEDPIRFDYREFDVDLADSSSAGPQSAVRTEISWYDKNDHDRTFDIDFRSRFESSIFFLADTSYSGSGTCQICAFFYYKDGSIINVTAGSLGGIVIGNFAASGFSRPLWGSILPTTYSSFGAQAWESAGSEAVSLRPSGVSLGLLFTGGGVDRYGSWSQKAILNMCTYKTPVQP